MGKRIEDQHVLVVDNSQAMTLLIKHHLTEIGYHQKNIFLATDGHQASMMVELQDFDLITSSVYLKSKNVPELIKKIRSHEKEKMREIPFLVISGQKSQSMIDELKNEGASGILGKPFLPEELSEALKRLSSGNGFVTFDQKFEKASQGNSVERCSTTIDSKIVSAFIETSLESFAQYMIAAEPGEIEESPEVSSDFSSLIDLTDEKHGVRLVILLFFPKKVACSIYEAIFGEVDLTLVCGVVEELGNIIGGVVKVKVADLSREIYSTVYHGKQLEDGAELDYQLGLPQAKMGDIRWEEVEGGSCPNFSVPFEVNGEKVHLQVHFQEI